MPRRFCRRNTSYGASVTSACLQQALKQEIPFVALEADHAVFSQQCRYTAGLANCWGCRVCLRSWVVSSGGYTPHSAGHDITVNHGRFSQGSGIIRFSDFPAEKRLVTAIACSEPAGAKPGASRRPVITVVRLSKQLSLEQLGLVHQVLVGALEAGPGLGGTVITPSSRSTSSFLHRRSSCPCGSRSPGRILHGTGCVSWLPQSGCGGSSPTRSSSWRSFARIFSASSFSISSFCSARASMCSLVV